MTVIAGPPGSGKSKVGIKHVLHGQDYFNIDNRCAELNNNSFQRIPPEIRKQAIQECEQWILQHILEQKSFAVESTFRTDAAIIQSEIAEKNGFETRLYFYSLENVNLNIERVKARAYAGGHSAPTDKIAETYRASISNLSEAFSAFDYVTGYDNTLSDPRKIFTVEKNRLMQLDQVVPEWAKEALYKADMII